MAERTPANVGAAQNTDPGDHHDQIVDESPLSRRSGTNTTAINSSSREIEGVYAGMARIVKEQMLEREAGDRENLLLYDASHTSIDALDLPRARVDHGCVRP